MESSSTKRLPSRRASSRPTVLLPAPGTPTTDTRRTRPACHLGPHVRTGCDRRGSGHGCTSGVHWCPEPAGEGEVGGVGARQAGTGAPNLRGGAGSRSGGGRNLHDIAIVLRTHEETNQPPPPQSGRGRGRERESKYV